MGDSLIGKATKWGIGLETTAGTDVDPTAGISNYNKATITPGQDWIEDPKGTGKPVLTTDEIYDGNLNPTFSPEMTMTYPLLGELFYMLTQEGAETGAGPYIQTLQPATTTGKELALGDTIGANQLSCSIKETSGQSGSRDVRAGGGIVNRIDITFPETGLIKVTPSFMFLTYDDGVASGGTYTLPGQSSEFMTRDFHYKLGDGTPAALYSKELSLSFIADVVIQHYAGFNTANAGGPFKFTYNGWSLEGSFSKPIIAGTDTLLKDFLIEGGDTGKDQLLYIYKSSLTDYDEAASSMADGEIRFTLNIKFDDITKNLDDETREDVTFKGAHDGTNNIFMLEQVTTASQTWCL